MSNITVRREENDWAVIFDGLVFNYYPTEAEAISECEKLNNVYKMLNELQVFVEQNIIDRYDDATIAMFRHQFDLDNIFA